MKLPACCAPVFDARGAPQLTLGIDLGTSAIKVVALGLDDQPVGEGVAPFVTLSEQPNQAEQRTGDWLAAASTAMRQLASDQEGSIGASWRQQVAAIGVTGQLPTLVCLGDAQPLAPAITWRDGRADDWAASRMTPARRAAMYSRTGMPIDGRYLAPMLHFHFAQRLAEVRTVLSAKDYLIAELTGRRVTEPSTAAGYGIYDLCQRAFSTELADFWGLPLAALPEVLGANRLAGPLHAAGAALLDLPAGIPVSTGAADSVCAAYSMAALDARAVSISFGSSAVVIGAHRTLRLDSSARYLLTPHVDGEWYAREMDLLSTGTGYRWLGELFSWSDGELDRYAAQSVPGAQGLIFAPYLAGGEQGALWNPRLRGGLFGLTLRHSRADIARSFIEGVFFEVRRCVEVLAESAPVDSVIISGNIVRSPSSMQILADILQRPVSPVQTKSPAAAGVAALARGIAGLARDSARLVRPRDGSQPEPSAAEVYETLYHRYLARSAQCE